MTTTMMIQVRPARRDSSYIIIITIIITKHIVHFLVSWYYTTLRTYQVPSQTIHLPVSLTPRLHFAFSPLSLLRVGST